MQQASTATVSLASLDAAVERLARAVHTVDPGQPVPSCPGWTATHLITHVAQIHEWACRAIRQDAEPAKPSESSSPSGALSAWYRVRAGALLEVLGEVGPDVPCWTFGPEPGRSSFWLRRQLHEVTVHTWDMFAADGRDFVPERRLAWDGVKEVQEVFYPRQVGLGRMKPLERKLILEASDLDEEPVVIGQGRAVHVRASATELLLLLWQRTTYDHDVSVSDLFSEALTP